MEPLAILLAALTLMDPDSAPSSLTGLLTRPVSAERMLSDVTTLAAFGTRHTLSDSTSETRGIGAARRWIKSEFEKCGPNLQVSFEEFDAPKSQRLPEGGHLVNVVAILPGTMPEAKSRSYYIVGHYDSRNSDPMNVTDDAPGANDDASGTAVVIEAARMLSRHPLESTVVFLCTSGEEQGLIGATYHADHAADRGFTIKAVLSNDIVGDPVPKPDGDDTTLAARRADAAKIIRVFSEGLPRRASAEELARIRQLGAESDSASRQLARFIVEVAENENTAIRPVLIFRPDRFLRGGDHTPFNDRGYPAVRFTTMYEEYSRQHADVKKQTLPDGITTMVGDLPKFVDGQYLGQVTRLNIAALIHLANAPSPPSEVRVITKNLSTDTTLRWKASPEPDVAGYEVVTRDTLSPIWTRVIDAGLRTELVVHESKDNVFFGVRAYDKDGFRGPVAFAGAATE